MIIINLYCPTKDKLKLQLEFLETVKTHIENHSDKNLLIGGDLNTYLDPRLDKQGGRMETVSEYWKELTALCEDYSLVDIWRIRNQNKKEFTRSANSRGGVVESRLDYWLVSMGITYLVKNIEIIDGLDSDHSIVTMKLNLLNTCKRGKRYWKFNNDLLTDKIFIEKIKTTIQKIKDENQMENKNTLWEFTKCEIRGLTMKYAKKKAKKERHLERELSQKVQLLKGNINGDDTKIQRI